MGRLGLPELFIIIGVLAVFCVPLFLAYRLGYNSGYRKALEKAMEERTR